MSQDTSIRIKKETKAKLEKIWSLHVNPEQYDSFDSLISDMADHILNERARLEVFRQSMKE